MRGIVALNEIPGPGVQLCDWFGLELGRERRRFHENGASLNFQTGSGNRPVQAGQAARGGGGRVVPG
jgi:hypothetical protein